MAVQAEVEAGSGQVTYTVRQAPASGQLRLVLRTPAWARAHVHQWGDTHGEHAARLLPEVGFQVIAEVERLPWKSLLPTGRTSYFSGPLLLGAPVHLDGGADRGAVAPEALRPVGVLPNDIPPSGAAPTYRVAFAG